MTFLPEKKKNETMVQLQRTNERTNQRGLAQEIFESLGASGRQLLQPPTFLEEVVFLKKKMAHNLDFFWVVAEVIPQKRQMIFRLRNSFKLCRNCRR